MGLHQNVQAMGVKNLSNFLQSSLSTCLSNNLFIRNANATILKYRFQSRTLSSYTLSKDITAIDELSNIKRSGTGTTTLGMTPVQIHWGDLFQKSNLKTILEQLLQHNDNSYMFLRELLESKQLTFNEFSIFLNRLIDRKGFIYDSIVLKEFPNGKHSEMVFKLFQLYGNAIGSDKLSLLSLRDMNLFIEFFINEGHLGRAEIVLTFVLNKTRSILDLYDVDTVTHYLQLRCGALPRYWMFQNKSAELAYKDKFGNRLSKYKTRLGRKNFAVKLTNRYKILDPLGVLKIANKIITDDKWKSNHSAKLDATVVYSLCYSGQLSNIPSYINSRWNVDISMSDGNSDVGTQISNEASKPLPSEVMEAILSSYSYDDKSIERAINIIDKIMNSYPNLELNQQFWRRLMQWSVLCWDHKLDRKGSLVYGCFKTLKKYHEMRSIRINFDEGLLQELYTLVYYTKNSRIAAEVVSEFMPQFFYKRSDEITFGERKLLFYFQKRSIDGMLGKKDYFTASNFIEKWSMDNQNKEELFKYYKDSIAKKLQKVRRNSLQQKIKEKLEDHSDEDDTLLGRLW
ncbi:hypothetical protein TPHA_0I00290 [Tetrapisispora phaffii CBS 4417]|uniref:ATPase expression protein 2, mitochondrial n=1 Tax=Tetrapisispora phaffii (strain ATCC 24235 / CBS 4417 / NBRC 1672 / NRRL Y-8282 / UCD 70-5) TaxID=1071381 RepID=G8BXA8_TETPH|nr:hypothetical protein TPHA_0I00290 [Tetrapisispora phaffii CBS 4417]CCE64536.1 hypothetical protein TPHA_0I00290 [Tetrapisispora phaffii CBS 4417]